MFLRRMRLARLPLGDWPTLVVTTVIVLWIARVYSLGESVEFGRRLTSDELRSVAVRELSIPLAAMARPAGSYSAPMEC